MKKSMLVALLAGVSALSAQAEAYRIGLWQEKINSANKWDQAASVFNEVTMVGPAMAHVKATESNYGSVYYTDAVTGKATKWNKQNTTFVYSGEIALEAGVTYTFGKYLDDGAYIVLNGSKLISDTNYQGFPTGSYTPTATGWYPIEIRVGDGSGGKGPSGGSWPNDMGLGVNTNGLTSQSAPSEGGWVKLVDPGDGSLFRAPTDERFLTLDAVAPITGGYRFTVTVLKDCNVRLYAGATAGAELDPTTWDRCSDELSFTTNAPSQTIDLLWEGASRPVVALAAEGDDEIGRFREWMGPVPLTPTPAVAATLDLVEATSAAFDVVLDYPVLVAGDEPETRIYAYACELGSTVTNRLDLGVQSIGANELTVTGLNENSAYTVWFGADNGQSEEKFSNEIFLSTAGLTVGCPSEVYECDARDFLFTVSRQIGSEGSEVTVNLAWTGNTEAFVSPLPESVTLPAGALSATVAVKTIDNDGTDAARSLTLTLQESTEYRLAPVHTATTTVVDDDSLTPEVAVWNGAGGDLRWENPVNWKSERVPRPIDSVKFVSNGLSAGNTVQISDDELIRELIIETTTAFTIAGTGVTLTLDGITRKDVDGTEGYHDIRVPLALFAGSETNCIWNIAGSNSLRIYSDMAKIGDVWACKTGAGKVEMCKETQRYPGPWIVAEGTIATPVAHAIKGNLYIGGGDAAASVTLNHENGVGYNAYPYVYRNGYFGGNYKVENGRAETIRTFEGGTAQVGSYSYVYYLYMQGGTFNCGSSWNARDITCYAADEMATLNASWRFSGSRSVTVARGTCPVDLKVVNQLTEGGSGETITKKGDGVVKSTVNFGGLKDHFKIDAGAWYVDNPSEYGLGIQECVVAKGATIGGVGFVGMKDSKGGATLTLNAGDETTYATIAPGTIDEVTGAHSNGTFTVAREAAHNALSLGNYSHLVIGVGAKDPETKLSPVDKLKVNGELWIGENCTLDLVSNTIEDLTMVAGGTYTIVEAVDGISGTFATVLKPKGSWNVRYIEEDDKVVRIELSATGNGFTVILK